MATLGDPRRIGYALALGLFVAGVATIFGLLLGDSGLRLFGTAGGIGAGFAIGVVLLWREAA